MWPSKKFKAAKDALNGMKLAQLMKMDNFFFKSLSTWVQEFFSGL